MPIVNDSAEPIEGFVTLHVPCRFSYLRIIRQTVVDVSARSGLSELSTAKLEMAVDEACANIIEHSYGGESDGDENHNHPGLRINFVQYPKRVLVEVFDHGSGFDFDNHSIMEPERFADGPTGRGLGMYIINKFVDDVDYERATEYGNCLRLTKVV